MFIGHFGAGFAAKRAAPRVSLGWLFLAAAGVWLYARSTRARDVAGRIGLVALVALLAAIHAANLLGPPPPSVTAIAWVGEAQWLVVLLGFWLDRHRAAALD